jgi:hypothetical protein
MNVKGGQWEGSPGGKRGKEMILRGKKDQNMLHIYIRRHIMKPTKHCLKKRVEGRERMGI